MGRMAGQPPTDESEHFIRCPARGWIEAKAHFQKNWEPGRFGRLGSLSAVVRRLQTSERQRAPENDQRGPQS